MDKHPATMLRGGLYEKSPKLAALLATGEMFDDEVRMRHKDGVYRWARARAYRSVTHKGNVVRYLSCQIDIDDLKRAEALLAAEVKLLEMVARGEPLGRVLDALSRHVEELCSGCFCSVLVVAPDRKHLHVGAGPNLLKAFYNIADGDGGFSDPCSLAVIEKAPIISGDLASDPRWQGSPWLPVMNSLGFVSCCAMPILSASGEVSGVVAIYRSERCSPTPARKKTSSTGSQKSRGSRSIALRLTQPSRRANGNCAKPLRSSPRGSASARPAASPRTSSRIGTVGRTSSTASSRSIAPRRPGLKRSAPGFIRMTATLRRGDATRIEGRGADFTFRVVTPSGGLKHLRGVSQVIEHIAGRPIFMGTIQDVTESKLAEEALNQTRSELAHVARVATLNAMTASIAHEVSQPLSGILTNANTCVRMLAADPPNLAGAAETARRTIRDANRATEVIQRLRAMFSTKAPTHGDGGS